MGRFTVADSLSMSISGGQTLMVEVADLHSATFISTSATAGMSAPAQFSRPRMSSLVKAESGDRIILWRTWISRLNIDSGAGKSWPTQDSVVSAEELHDLMLCWIGA
eukprot:199986-Pyramimonas_sp.AAC.1